ncbi:MULTISPECIES: hypothetical protein [unclassified Pseudomonas]|uniref:hypothetical protein n=1 Tax=unclassified Pseudomonas TaxID=196821 RepID=UPI00119F4A85|nr:MULTISPECIES: hypothetical protein [unclassified Pseudomonas]TWC27673.1 hypothetical protein FBY05_101538 [Pseudomonas sp. SJZ083]TWC53987.1 hypothetical protein FBY01_101178 [Pseudomonas sp. SJZ077]
MSTSYADSAQAREWDRRYDAWGREKKAKPEEFHDYEAEALKRTQALADRKARLVEERKSLKRRIGATMVQMEMVCPPKGGAT